MSIEYGAALVVGLLGHNFTADEINQHCHETERLSKYAPFFDAPIRDSVVGLPVYVSEDYCEYEIYDPENISVSIERLKLEFYEITGKEASVYLTPRSD